MLSWNLAGCRIGSRAHFCAHRSQCSSSLPVHSTRCTSKSLCSVACRFPIFSDSRSPAHKHCCRQWQAAPVSSTPICAPTCVPSCAPTCRPWQAASVLISFVTHLSQITESHPALPDSSQIQGYTEALSPYDLSVSMWGGAYPHCLRRRAAM